MLTNIICAPVMDPTFVATLKDEVGANKHTMRAWVAGWHAENLAQPVG